MGNDPVNSVDPSGGCTWCQTLARALWLPNVTVVGHRAAPSLAKKIGQVGLGVAKGVGKSLLNIITSSAILSSPQLFPKQSTEMIYGFGQALKAAGQISPVNPTAGLAALYGMDKYSRFTTGNRIQKGEVGGEVILDLGSLFIGGEGAIAKIGEIDKLVELGEIGAEVSRIGKIQVEQYALRAAEDGFYPVMKRGFVNPQELIWLNKGEVWKFGTTRNPLKRYSQAFLDNTGEGLRYTTEFSGTVKEATTLERMKILNYKGQTGILPAGNKIIR